MTQITVTVPADPESLAVVRTIVALLGHGTTRVTLDISVTAGRLAVSATSDGDPALWLCGLLENAVGHLREQQGCRRG